MVATCRCERRIRLSHRRVPSERPLRMRAGTAYPGAHYCGLLVTRAGEKGLEPSRTYSSSRACPCAACVMAWRFHRRP